VRVRCAFLHQVIGKYPQLAVISDESYRTAIYNGASRALVVEVVFLLTHTRFDRNVADEPYSSIAHHLPLQTLVVAGISKELSSTGLRLGAPRPQHAHAHTIRCWVLSDTPRPNQPPGWVAGPAQIIRVIANVHGNATSCVNLPVQVGLAQFLRYTNQSIF
jgi:aspartate/methionine/tyrosine aminotransferase